MTPGLPVQTEQGTALAFMNGGRVDPRSGLLCTEVCSISVAVSSRITILEKIPS